MNRGNRITLTDTPQTIVVKLSGDNPGAIQCLTELIVAAPDQVRGVMHLLRFDTHNIVGSHIYLIWNDLLDRDSKKMYELLSTDKLRGFIMEKYNEDPGFKHEWDYHKGPTWRI